MAGDDRRRGGVQWQPERRTLIRAAHEGSGVMLARWLRALRARIVNALVADEETSRIYDQADREQRIREGRLP
jgi:hypothetical protein